MVSKPTENLFKQEIESEYSVLVFTQEEKPMPSAQSREEAAPQGSQPPKSPCPLSEICMTISMCFGSTDTRLESFHIQDYFAHL